MDKIVCRICNKEEHRKSFSQHLRLYHQINHYDYVCEHLEDFPNWHKCEICGTITNKPHCSKKCDAEWRKTLVGRKSPRYGIKITEEGRRNISNACKNHWSKNMFPWTGKHHTEKTKEKLSKIAFEQDRSGSRNGMYGRTHTAESLKKIFSYRPITSLETLVKNILDEYKIKYEFQYFMDADGVWKSYDFKIKGKPILIEADGDYWHGNPNTKHHFKGYKKIQKNDRLKEKIAKKNGMELIRIWENDIKSNPEIFISKLKDLNLIKD